MAIGDPMRQGRFYVGTSGWVYPHWRGLFYPEPLKQDQWLDYYCQHFDTVEVNNTFYHLPSKAAFEHWREATPSDFRFCVKASRFITHMKKLKDPASSTHKFLEHAAGLGNKLAMVLFQLPPFWKLNLDRFRAFLEFLADQEIIQPLRATFEIRNSEWFNEQVFALLSAANVALCFADWPELKVDKPVTADFVYLRRHGPSELYSSDYTDEMLRADAERVCQWLNQEKDVFAYFNNDVGGFAIKNALRLRDLVEDGLG
jgi:uncharacterized protein YecE (DUF72 family)